MPKLLYPWRGSTAAAAEHWLNATGRVTLLTNNEELELGCAVQAWQQWPRGPNAAPAQVRRGGFSA